MFGQFLIGASRFAGSNAFVMQPGAGLDIRGTGRVSTRVNVDYLVERGEGETTKGFRVAAGLVFDITQ